MSDAKKCDRCGDYFEPKPESNCMVEIDDEYVVIFGFGKPMTPEEKAVYERMPFSFRGFDKPINKRIDVCDDCELTLLRKAFDNLMKKSKWDNLLRG